MEEEEWEGGVLDDVTPDVAAERYVIYWLKADNKAANSCCRCSFRCRSSSRRCSVPLGESRRSSSSRLSSSQLSMC